jgi:hypothetical protein
MQEVAQSAGEAASQDAALEVAAQIAPPEFDETADIRVGTEAAGHSRG